MKLISTHAYKFLSHIMLASSGVIYQKIITRLCGMMKEFIVKMQVHEYKNATSEIISTHCGPCLLLSASLSSSAWKKSIMMQLSLLQWGQSL